MSGDKRSVATDALETLGMEIDVNEQARDAIHLAVQPVIAQQRLFPGQEIGIAISKSPNGPLYAVPADGQNVKALGIVDPFLEQPVMPGVGFWLVVMPRQIKSLRHVWEHPDFPASGEVTLQAKSPKPKRTTRKQRQPAPEPVIDDPVQSSRDWIEAYAIHELDIDSGDALVQAAYNYLMFDDYMIDGGKFEGVRLNDEFWDHYEVVTGEVVSQERRGSFFSCSC